MMIDYQLLHESIHFYESYDYQRIETPWLVTKAISDITKPPGASSYVVKKDCETKEKVFVASGEQGFLYLINKGHLPSEGQFQTITPCMRNDSFDQIHTKYFMKNELIWYSPKVMCADNALIVAQHALKFFKLMAPNASMKIVNTGDLSWDIELDGVEIGSYGVRKSLICNWVYGTGLAEPRFSTLVKASYGRIS